MLSFTKPVALVPLAALVVWGSPLMRRRRRVEGEAYSRET